jgi:hypothetical protein
MKKREINGLSKSDKILLVGVLDCFIGTRKDLRELITEQGYKKILEIHWSLGMDLISELCLQDKKSFDKYAKESFERFLELNKQL